MTTSRHSGALMLAIALLMTAAVAHASAAAGRSLAGVSAREWTPTSTVPVTTYGDGAGKAVVDTVTLMGPGGMYPYRGDFETVSPRPAAEGRLADGWTSIDYTSPINGWHVDTYRNPFTGKAAWCGDLAIASCGSDPAGGYGNNWYGMLEFRKTVGAAPATVRVQANVQYDCEPAYDYLMLQRRTAAAPAFEPVATGQGLSWDGIGTTAVDYTFTWTAAELLGGTDIAVAFVFDADGGWSDGDCSYPSDGAARVDDVIVTVNGTAVYSEDFEDGALGPDWTATPNQGVGDYARVWDAAGDLDDCAANYSRLVAFLDDGLVVPGTGGTRGTTGMDYGPGGWVVNGRGGMLGYNNGLDNSILSPVMDLPDPTAGGLTLAFDVYRHETYSTSSAGVFYTWDIRSTAGGDITQAAWVNRNFVYYGGPAWVRAVNQADDLLVPGATQAQVRLSAMQFNWFFCYGCGWGIPTPAPYFDNVNVKAYRGTGPRIVVTETRLANDVFPASGALDLANLGANSCRFDMAANISLKTHNRNDPGDSIWVEATPRSGGTLSTPVMHWKFAKKNPLFTDAHRTALASGQVEGNVAGRVTRTATGTIVANRWNFDLPDTGMLFPGDVLHYYFAATDVVAGDTRTSTAPADLSGYGRPNPLTYPAAFTVNCLPSVRDAQGAQPTILLWNDSGNRGNDDEWNTTLQLLCQVGGLDYDVFNTHGAASGVGNGLGGRATVPQITGYADMLYTCGDLGAFTLSNGDYNVDAGNDLGLLEAWLGLGSRDLFVAGDDLAASLYASGTAGRDFLANRLGASYVDGDVRDNIDGQDQPRVVKVSGNPVFTTANAWTVNGGCPTFNDFDYVTPLPGAVRLAQFTGTDGASTPYTAAAAILKVNGTSRVISLDHDLSYIIDNAKIGSPRPYRVWVLSNVLDYFQAALNFGDCYAGTPPLPAVPGSFAVTSYPNPFNPSVTLHYSLPKLGPVTMKVFDARGTLVRTLLDGPVETAEGSVVWNGTDQRGGRAPSGLYFVETRAGDQVDVRKVTMLK
jgi:hypothetical protein